MSNELFMHSVYNGNHWVKGALLLIERTLELSHFLFIFDPSLGAGRKKGDRLDLSCFIAPFILRFVFPERPTGFSGRCSRTAYHKCWNRFLCLNCISIPRKYDAIRCSINKSLNAVFYFFSFLFSYRLNAHPLWTTFILCCILCRVVFSVRSDVKNATFCF